jgi:uncharacterized protein (TIGR03435 family)
MKRREPKVEEFMLRHLGLFKTPPAEEMHVAEKRIQNRLRSAPIVNEPLDETTLPPRNSNFLRVAAVFGGTVAAVLVLGLLLRTQPLAVNVQTGDYIEPGDTVLTKGSGAEVALADGSRLDVQAQSEFSIDRAEDGIRIHLKSGSLIVKAAKQLTGHLYVNTRDVVVSVVGTTFLVSVEEEGSRVAVIEGEVRVQQGTILRTLLAGQKLSTSAKMETFEVKKEVSWSSKAETPVALPKQSAAGTPPAPAAQNPVETRFAFEVVSIRPGAPFQAPSGGNRGAPPGEPGRTPATPAGLEPALARTLTCGGPGSALEVDPGRITLRNGTVYRLIVLAYGLKDCILALQMGLVEGGPEWVRTDRYEIQATIPEGSPVYTQQQLMNAEAPRIQAMIQTLLAERFNLVLQREPKDLPAYNLVVARAGRIKASEDQTPPPPLVPGTPLRTGALPRGAMLNCTGSAITIGQFSNCLQKVVGATVLNKTDLKGLYDIPLYTPDGTQPGLFAPQILEPLGLKLEPTKAHGEVFAIKRVNRPTEN